MRRWWPVVAYVAGLYAAVPFARQIVDALRAEALLKVVLVGLTVLAASASLWMFRGRKIRYVLAVPPLAVLAVWAFNLDVLEERIHLVQYSFLAVLVSRAEPRPLRVFLLAAALGAGDEALQALVPSRVFDWRDIGFNVGAAALGTVLAAAMSRSSTPHAGSADSAAHPSL